MSRTVCKDFCENFLGVAFDTGTCRIDPQHSANSLCIAVSLFYSLKEICSSITKPDKHLPVCASAQLCLCNNYPCSGRLHLSVCVGTTGPKRIKSRVTKFCFTRGSLVWFWFLVVFCGAWKWVGCALHCIVSMSIGFIGNILLLCPCPIGRRY